MKRARHPYDHFEIVVRGGKPTVRVRQAKHIYEYASPSIGDAPATHLVKHALHVLRRLIDRRARPYRVKKAWRRFEVARINAGATVR